MVEIEFEQQVKLRDSLTEYNPLYDVNILNCWTSAPLYDQLDPGQSKRTQEK
ncbi:MAG: hypothetical protein R2784_05080 [Saprospiraceae bacterium]